LGVVKAIKLAFLSVYKGSAIFAHIFTHIFASLLLVVCLVIFDIIFIGSLPEPVITPSLFLPGMLLAKTFEVIRVLFPPFALVMELTQPLTSRI